MKEFQKFILVQKFEPEVKLIHNRRYISFIIIYLFNNNILAMTELHNMVAIIQTIS